MHGQMIDLQRYSATSWERNFTEQISNFLEALLAIEIMQEPQSNLEYKVNLSILKDIFPQQKNPSFSHQ